MKIKIIQKVSDCIGCTTCATLCPETWEMKKQKAHLKNTVFSEQKEEVTKDLDLNEIKKHENAEQSCPVNCIKLLKTTEKILLSEKK